MVNKLPLGLFEYLPLQMFELISQLGLIFKFLQTAVNLKAENKAELIVSIKTLIKATWLSTYLLIMISRHQNICDTRCLWSQ